MATPLSASVVVPSHGRPLRLRWLLNALEEQTFGEPWEVIVVHDYEESTVARFLGDHPLASDGRLRHIAIEPGTGSPARQRNIGWRSARGRMIAFTDDDCRPEPEWLDRLVASVRDRDADVVQGATRPDPHEAHLLAAPHVRTMFIEPVGPYAQTCNILYPRAVLERLGGFDERAITGEDVDMSHRAKALGSHIVGARRAVVNHAVESHTLPGMLQQNLKWRHLAYLVKRNPEVRRDLFLRVFWDRDHLLVPVGLGGLAAAVARRRGALARLFAPYAWRATRRRGRRPRGLVTGLVELPGQTRRQFAEVLGMAAGSVRHRTFLL